MASSIHQPSYNNSSVTADEQLRVLFSFASSYSTMACQHLPLSVSLLSVAIYPLQIPARFVVPVPAVAL